MKSKNDKFSVAKHDIKNHLSILKANIFLLEKSKDPKKNELIMNKLETEVDIIDAILNNFK